MVWVVDGRVARYPEDSMVAAERYLIGRLRIHVEKHRPNALAKQGGAGPEGDEVSIQRSVRIGGCKDGSLEQ